MENEWHTYWRNPGDAGLPTSIRWDLPDGFSAGGIGWPFPERFGEPPEVSYGYKHEVFLPVEITPPMNLASDTAVVLRAEAGWLVCREACIPGRATLELKLPVGTRELPSKWNSQLAETYRMIPVDADVLDALDLHVSAARHDAGYQLHVESGTQAPSGYLPSEITFFPFEQGVIDHSAEERLIQAPDSRTIILPISPFSVEPAERLTGVLYAPDGFKSDGSVHAIAVDVPIAVE
jgi:thiol:disulfide interchange protein DsbD